jgi:hypothetical protein
MRNPDPVSRSPGLASERLWREVSSERLRRCHRGRRVAGRVDGSDEREPPPGRGQSSLPRSMSESATPSRRAHAAISPAQLGGPRPAPPFVDPDRGRRPVAERRVRRSSPAKDSSRYATSLRSRRSFIRRSRSAATSATANCQRPPASRCPRRAPVLASRRTSRVETPRAIAASAVPRNCEASRADIGGAPFLDLEKPSWLDDRTCETTSGPRLVPEVECEAEPDSCPSCQLVPTWMRAVIARNTSSQRSAGIPDRASSRSSPPG